MAKRPTTGAGEMQRIRRVRTKADIDALNDQVRQLERNREEEREPAARRVAELEAMLASERKTLAQIDGRFERVIDPRLNKILAASEEGREELTEGKTQTIALPTGALTFRLSTISLKPDKLTIEIRDRIVARLRRLRKIKQFVRYLPQIDFAGLRQRPEIYSKIPELVPVRVERFTVAPAGSKVRFVTVLGSGVWEREAVTD